jgi:hypothetical protein
LERNAQHISALPARRYGANLRYMDENRTHSQKLRVTATVLYVSLALAWLLIPQSVSNWTRETLPAFAQPFASQAAESVEWLARKTGLPALYDSARELFLQAAK